MWPLISCAVQGRSSLHAQIVNTLKCLLRWHFAWLLWLIYGPKDCCSYEEMQIGGPFWIMRCIPEENSLSFLQIIIFKSKEEQRMAQKTFLSFKKSLMNHRTGFAARHRTVTWVSALPPIGSLELLPTGSTAGKKKSDLSVFESDGGEVQPVSLFIFERTFPFHFFLHGLFPRWMHKINPTDEKPSICCV